MVIRRRPHGLSGAASSSIRVPTLLGTKASGIRVAMAWVARQPVQWAGTTTSGRRSARAATVPAYFSPHRTRRQARRRQRVTVPPVAHRSP
jgi:hypothetical protein